MSKASATLFTALVAPVLVNFIVHAFPPPQSDSLPVQPRPCATANEADGERDVVVSERRGASPTLAKQAALRSALLRIAALLVEPGTSGNAYQAICEAILHDPGDVFIRCVDQGAKVLSGPATERYSHCLTVEISRDRLADRLRTAGLRIKAR
jgi:hypothetical protein